MTTTTSEGPAIVIGYAWRLTLTADTPLFPSGSLFVAEVRVKVGAKDVLARLTSANGGITRLSDTELALYIPPTDTKNMDVGFVVMDVVRTDLVPEQYLNFLLEIPVVMPVTLAADL